MDWRLWVQQRRAKLVWISIGLCLAAYLVTQIWLSQIELTEKGLHYQWVALKDSTDRRRQLLSNFATLGQAVDPQQIAFYQQLLQAQTQAQGIDLDENRMVDQNAVIAFCSNQAQIGKLLQHLQQRAKANPALGQNEQYMLLSAQLNTLHQRIQAANMGLDYEVARYNSVLLGYPEQWVGSLMGLEPKYSCHMAL